MIKAVLELKKDNGKLMSEFLNTLECRSNECSMAYTKCLTIARVESSLNVRWPQKDFADMFNFAEKQTQRSSKTSSKPFSLLRDQVIDTLIANLKQYFPEGSFSMFDVLSPREFDLAKAKTRTYGNIQIGEIAERFGINKETTVTQWQDFMYGLAMVDIFEFDAAKAIKHDSNAINFWHFIMTDPKFKMGNNVRKLLRTVLVPPAASADAEMAFSAMQLIKSSRRTNPNEGSLQNLLRVNLNGPSKIGDFTDMAA